MTSPLTASQAQAEAEAQAHPQSLSKRKLVPVPSPPYYTQVQREGKTKDRNRQRTVPEYLALQRAKETSLAKRSKKRRQDCARTTQERFCLTRSHCPHDNAPALHSAGAIFQTLCDVGAGFGSRSGNPRTRHR
uniref:Uncharacterized protein n=1 Tax=Craspedostauros australis TaxID=1486917 RepID=A0A7R9WUB0_9STRA